MQAIFLTGTTTFCSKRQGLPSVIQGTRPDGAACAFQLVALVAIIFGHALVRKKAKPPADYETYQTLPLQPRMIRVLVSALSSNNHYVLFIATFWVLLVLSCLRPFHLQTSSISVLPERIEGHVSFGKAKPRCHRKPFYWSCGRTFFGCIDVGPILKGVLEQTGMGTSSSRGIMPDSLPKGPNWRQNQFSNCNR